MRQTTVATLAMISLLCVPAFSGCGANLFQATEKSDPSTTAARALEQKRPSAAIKTLENALEHDPGNATYLSLLSAAYAQRAGIEPLSLAEAMAAKSSGRALTLLGSTDSLVSLFDVMPAATTDTVSDIQKAVSILTDDLPRADWLPGDAFKFAVYQTASLVLSLKILDTNGDGKLSLLEIMGMSGGSSIVSQLSAAASVLGASGGSTAATQVASLLSSQKSAIDATEGATSEEKLKNYLSSASGGSSTAASTGTSAVTSTSLTTPFDGELEAD